MALSMQRAIRGRAMSLMNVSQRIAGSTMEESLRSTSMVPMMNMERGVVMSPMSLMAVSMKPGRLMPANWRMRPSITAMMQGLRNIFFALSLREEWVNRDMPAVHMAMRFGIMKIEAK